MAETAVSLALGEVFQLLKEETNLLRGVHKDFLDIKDELESIQVFLKDADRRAADKEDANEGIRTWVKQVREASFRIEDVIDEYLRLTYEVKDPGCGRLVCKIASLCLWDNCYDGEIFHFQNGGFLKLNTLNLSRLNRVNSVVIDNGTLLSLEHLTLEQIPQLKEVPSGIKYMHKLKDIYFTDMPTEFVESIDPDKGEDYSIIKHVPLVFIRHWYGPNLYDYDIHTIHSSSKES